MGPPIVQPRLGVLGLLRFGWRQLTSMRTALVLLLLLAVAAVPGSIWPQRSIDPERVRQYLLDHPDLGPWLDRVGMFEVFSSPWFAAIYLLLMISLIGCLVPRSVQHWRAIRAQPPRAPRRLARLPVHRHTTLDADPDEVLTVARQVLRGRRFRLRAQQPEGSDVAAESGYLKETGNLVFHIALLGVIVSVAAGHLWGWRAEVILPEGESFTSTAATYDTLQPGPWVDTTDLPGYGLTMNALDVEFETDVPADSAQFGAPRQFSSTVGVRPGPGEPVEEDTLAVNDPLQIDGTSVFLLGNGYAPVVTVRDADGQVLFSETVPFLPQDDRYTSTGAIKVPGADPGLGFYGGFLPTARIDENGPHSTFPGLVDPALVLGVYEGELYPDGQAQSVYTLDTETMDQVRDDSGDVARLLLRPGETKQLPGDRGSITLEEVRRWGGLVARHDPGRAPVLGFAVVLLASLVTMLAVRRRRVFVRALPGPGHTEVDVAGLTRSSDPGLALVVDDVLEQIETRTRRVAEEDQG